MFNIGSFFSGRGLDVQLKCFPVAHIGRDELEIGNRVILLLSTLDKVRCCSRRLILTGVENSRGCP